MSSSKFECLALRIRYPFFFCPQSSLKCGFLLIQPHHSEQAEVLHLKGPSWPSQVLQIQSAPTLGLQIAVNSQISNDAGTSWGTPKAQANPRLPSREAPACKKSLEGAELLILPSPLPRLVIVSVVCSQVKTFCGEQSVLEVL